MENLQANSVLTDRSSAVIETNKVLKNTYLLLSMTLLFSAVTAYFSAALALPHPGLFLTLAGYFGLLFLTHKFQNSSAGIACVFALTGFMGYTLGPILSALLGNGPKCSYAGLRRHSHCIL